MGEIYKITNTINGKIYIGQTNATAEKRFKHHYYNLRGNGCPKLYAAMRKHGFENFVCETIDVAETLNELNDKEKYWINELDTINNGYNIRPGGDMKDYRHVFTEDEIRRIRESKLGENNHNFGKKLTEDTKRKMSEARSGEKHGKAITVKFISPEGEEYVVKGGFKRFCEDHNISFMTMRNKLSGNHKGRTNNKWEIYKCSNNKCGNYRCG